jgi:hypothetical protein
MLIVLKVAGDGNCFYSAIQVLLGNEESKYHNLKKLVHDFARE